MHPQTLRIYETKGLVRPQRTPGNTRLYSEADLERLRLIQRLTTELGLNLAGVERVLRLEDELARLQRAHRAPRAGDARRGPARCTSSTSRDLVLYTRPTTRCPAERTTMDFNKLTHQVPGGRRRGAGARAAQRQPGGLPGAPAARAARPGAAAHARRACRTSVADAARRRPRRRCREAGRPGRAASSRAPRPRSRASSTEPRTRCGSSRTTSSRPSTCCSRSTSSRATQLLAGAQGRCAAASASPRRIPRAPTRRSRSSAAT